MIKSFHIIDIVNSVFWLIILVFFRRNIHEERFKKKVFSLKYKIKP